MPRHLPPDDDEPKKKKDEEEPEEVPAGPPDMDDIEYDTGADYDPEDSPLTDEEMEDCLEDLEEILDEIGPPAVLEYMSGYLYELPRPFHRIAKKLRDLAKRTERAMGAVEEARETRGLDG